MEKVLTARLCSGTNFPDIASNGFTDCRVDVETAEIGQETEAGVIIPAAR